MIVTKRNSLRLAAVGAMGAVTLALAGTTAMAATPAAHHQAAVTAARASLTAKPSVTTVKAWQQFRVTGTATGLKAGSKVTLQQVQHGKWVTLPASTTVTRSGAYSLRVELGLKGKNQLRMVSGSTVSAVFDVTVR
ncbi:hypothetical protein [Streptomyces sp. ICBB 8177]|uniref:hypothetical protein n=1 Tax=Streptomyces sp. ICBB 8177 TaxID=563922 RepID=UPI000D67372C|nr:hypothetical protein [Streptomyces sp. ICBB 8177]PWI40991.1 hypothetical protein CK485_26760 [Streptomyces sp. ICBB 8177]